MLEIIKAYINMHKADKMIDNLLDVAGASEHEQNWDEIRRLCDAVNKLHSEVAWKMWRDKNIAKTFNDNFNNILVPSCEEYIRKIK